MRPILILLSLALIAACSAPQVLEDRLTEADRTAPYPSLIPLGPLLAEAGPAPQIDAGADLSQRIAALNARAAALRGPVLDPATQARFADATN